MKTISNHLERKLIDSLRVGEKFTLLADESTDEAGRQQFALYGR